MSTDAKCIPIAGQYREPRSVHEFLYSELSANTITSGRSMNTSGEGVAERVMMPRWVIIFGHRNEPLLLWLGSCCFDGT